MGNLTQNIAQYQQLFIRRKSRSDLMKETDPYGWIMALLAMSVVFLALVLLTFVFKGTGKIGLKLDTEESRCLWQN